MDWGKTACFGTVGIFFPLFQNSLFHTSKLYFMPSNIQNTPPPSPKNKKILPRHFLLWSFMVPNIEKPAETFKN